MNLDPVVARLEGVIRRPVESVVDLAMLGERGPNFLPAVYVAPDSETPGPPRRLAGIHDQTVECTFVVLIMVGSNAADPKRIAGELQALTNDIEQRLVGWAHPDAEGQATAHAGSTLLAMAGGRIEWAIKFTTQRRIRKAVQ